MLVLGVHVEVFPRDAFVWRCHLNDLGRRFCQKRVRLTQRLFVYLLCEEEVRMHALPAPRRSEAEVSDERGLAYEIHSQKYTYFTVYAYL